MLEHGGGVLTAYSGDTTPVIPIRGRAGVGLFNIHYFDLNSINGGLIFRTGSVRIVPVTHQILPQRFSASFLFLAHPGQALVALLAFLSLH